MATFFESETGGHGRRWSVRIVFFFIAPLLSGFVFLFFVPLFLALFSGCPTPLP